MGIGMGVDALAGRVDQRIAGLVSTGPEHRSPIRPVSAVPEASRRVIRKTTHKGCQPVHEPDQPREHTNRTLRAEGDSPHRTVSAPKPILPAGSGSA